MPRLPRAVFPKHPHHITQRGNRRQKVFFEDDDYKIYLSLISHFAKAARVEIWGYCLMPNHIHLILTPKTRDGLRKMLGEAHRRYTRHINFREGWRGHLWQERFHSFAMDEEWLIACARYVEQNPVRAKLVKSPQDWPWSSAKAHLSGETDGIVKVEPLLQRMPNWKEFIASDITNLETEDIQLHTRTGRPLGNDDFLDKAEAKLKRTLRPKKPGRPKSKQK